MHPYYPFHIFLCFVTCISCHPEGSAFIRAKRSHGPSLQVDLGYEIYKGYYNQTSGLNEYKGIRYAASAAGENRWQRPQPPKKNRENVINATSWPQRCPQGPPAPTPPSYNFTGTEDCLFLSVFAPPDANDLPVFVWIHGGGYGAGQGNQEISMLEDHRGGFVAVIIQYRLGAFGFLAGDEVHRNGVVNAGILDQFEALTWVQDHIEKFGGDPSHVTIAGESAGGGSVMLLSMAYGGEVGTDLFTNIIASSPYLPMQYGYADWQPSQTYYSFAAAANCFPGRAYGNKSTTIFDCLRQTDTETLQNASFVIGSSGTFGTWGFLPVTDGDFIRERPTEQLLSGKVNGLRVLSGNNANEGPLFTIQNITTEAAFEDWTRLQFPNFNDTDLSEILQYYPSSKEDDNPSNVPFATTGTSPPYAVNWSSFGTGQQQRANNLYAETTFVCPSYWLAQAFSQPQRQAYKYQFSVPASQHGADLSAEGLRPTTPNISPQFEKAFAEIWRNFVINDNPSISSQLANGNDSDAFNPASAWPVFSRDNPKFINLNETGGAIFTTRIVNGVPNITEYEEPGIQNEITLQNAWTWEAGRGERCDFWVSKGPIVPE